MPDELSERFEERFSEILAYLDFLENVQTAVQSGVPQLGGEDGPVVTTLQQRILYSGVYLQLYNLAEFDHDGMFGCSKQGCDTTGPLGPGGFEHRIET